MYPPSRRVLRSLNCTAPSTKLVLPLPAITRAPRKNSDVILSPTNTDRIQQITAYGLRAPPAKAAIPAKTPPATGHLKFRHRLSMEVRRQASSGPTPVSNKRNSAMGIFTLLKNGGPTLMRLLVNHSEKTGNNVPQKTAKHAASSTKLLNRKLDSRETSESSWLSLRK